MIIRLFLLLVLLVGCSEDVPLIAQRIPEYPARKPVILILIDTLRADHVGAYGSEQGLTPVLDALARRSFVFREALANLRDCVSGIWYHESYRGSESQPWIAPCLIRSPSTYAMRFMAFVEALARSPKARGEFAGAMTDGVFGRYASC